MVIQIQKNRNMEPTVEFLIQPGGTRQVPRTKELPARLFFWIPETLFPKQKVVVQVNKFILILNGNESQKVEVTDQHAKLSLRGYGWSNTQDNLDLGPLFAAVSPDDLREAFRLAGEQILAGHFPKGAVDLATGAILERHVPIVFKLKDAQTKRWEETVNEENDDIWFNIVGVDIQRINTERILGAKISATGNQVQASFQRQDSRPGLFTSADLFRFDLKEFGWMMAQNTSSRTITDLRKKVSDEDIEAAFQSLALEIIEAAAKTVPQVNENSKPRPTNPKVWTPSTVSEVQLTRR